MEAKGRERESKVSLRFLLVVQLMVRMERGCVYACGYSHEFLREFRIHTPGVLDAPYCTRCSGNGKAEHPMRKLDIAPGG